MVKAARSERRAVVAVGVAARCSRSAYDTPRPVTDCSWSIRSDACA